MPSMNSFKRHALKLPSTVTSVDVCDASPHDVCAAAGTRLQTYDGATAAPKRQFTRFKDTVYGAVFRTDGRLLVAGGGDSVVQVFDANSRLLLRQFKGHKAPVHVVGFTENQLHVLSGGDDGLVALWDITSGQQVCALPGHADYVRGLAASPLDADVWATCGYDHTCKLWDLRQQRCWSIIDHQAPVEALAFFPSGSMLATASGSNICIWDVAGGRLMQRIAVHKKTATCVLVAHMFGSKPHVVSAGLDGHVKVLDADAYSPVTITKHHAPITCMAASSSGDVLVVGGANGSLLVHKKHKVNAPSADGGPGLRWQPQRATLARSQYAASKPALSSALSSAQDGIHACLMSKVPSSIQEELCRYRFKDALASALASAYPQIVEHVVGTLLRRGLLCTTLATSPSEVAVGLLHHCCQHLSHPQHARGAIAVAQHIVTFGTGLVEDAVAQAQLQHLTRTVSEELEVHEHLLTLLGQMHSLCACTS